ncbi:uncharacterized mitochondrial protein-like protein [Tanacetum coccineum]
MQNINSEEEITQDCIVMPIWKDASYFDSPFQRPLETKWVCRFRNKKDERRDCERKKSRGFLVYQMDVKSAFLYGTIEEDVDVTQPLGFKDPEHPDKVYKISSMGELTFFLGLQAQKKEDGIFISQDKYVAEILKKFNYFDVKSASTPVDLEKPLVKDRDADDVDVHLYRSMIGSLMYLTTSRPDIIFAVCACARFEVTLTTSHLLAVKRIFRYLKGNPTLGLWYSRDSPFELVAYTDSGYVGATQDRKSTTGGYLLTKGFDAGRHVKRGRDTKIPQSSGPPVKVGDEAVHKELGDRMERAATTASSLEAEQDSGSGPRCQDTILGGVDAHTSVPIPSNDPLLSSEDRMQLTELMILCTNLQKQVLDLEKAKDTQAKEIAILKKRVQKLERKKKSRTTGLQRLRKVGESSRVESSEDKENDAEMFDIDDLHDDEVIVDMAIVTTADEGVTAAKIDEITPTSAPTTIIDEITLAQTLIEIKAAKPKAVTTAATTITTRPKARGVVVQEPSEFRTTTSSPQTSQPSKTKDKGKAIMIEPEVPLKRKYQVALYEEMARNLEAQLQAKLIEEEKMARKKEEEANIALIESWENTQAMMKADKLLAERLQIREQEELTDEEKAKLFIEFIERRRKHFAELRA